MSVIFPSTVIFLFFYKGLHPFLFRWFYYWTYKNKIMPSRSTLKVIPSIVNGSDVHNNLNSWQNLSLQLVFNPIHISLIQEKISFRREYLANWKKWSLLFRCFSDPSRNITVWSAYCSKHSISFPIFIPFIFHFLLIYRYPIFLNT